MLFGHQIKGVLRTATGKPGEVICRIADEEHSAMICVGTRGMGRVRRTILGSVSDYLVHHAHCPVIVCRSRTRKQSGQSVKASPSTLFRLVYSNVASARCCSLLFVSPLCATELVMFLMRGQFAMIWYFSCRK